MNKEDSLAEYRKKRDFSKTLEPDGEKVRKTSKSPIFVIQKHDASSLHYDFRLQIGDRLVSWAVPKGPSTDPNKKRLAVRTEDHPLEYADFEGVIPEGEYGAGRVIVWDKGTYHRETAEEKQLSLEKSLEAGHISVWLEGKKLKGGYALIRMKRGEMWLLVKKQDTAADAWRKPVSTETESVISAKTIKTISKN